MCVWKTMPYVCTAAREQRGFDLEHVQSGTLSQGLWGVIMSACSRAQVASLQGMGAHSAPSPGMARVFAPSPGEPACGPGLPLLPLTQLTAPADGGAGIALRGPHDMQPVWHSSGSARGQNQ